MKKLRENPGFLSAVNASTFALQEIWAGVRASKLIIIR